MNLYNILGCSKNASTLEIKKAYQTLILKYHPDKSISENTTDTERYISITKAWQILGNPATRQKYDAELIAEQHKNKPPLYASLIRDELSYDEESEIYFYPCRCGGTYMIERNEIGNEDFYLNCDECSFSIFIKINNDCS
uniref:Putative dnaj molecular chaperone similarity domain protein n=1 Tax=Xenopsylla cheopis TaxID=163159 RepID=A0A6M2DFY3_XENCH